MAISTEVIEEVKRRLVEVYDPVKIYLFGSYAWGCPTEDSDLDLLIIIDTSDEQRHKRGKQGFLALWGLGISKDLMVYTQDEIEQRASDATSLVHKILQKGKVLYARS
jgi:predicted nucleotidyltransferase